MTYEFTLIKSARARVFSSSASKLAILLCSSFSLMFLHARPLPLGIASSNSDIFTTCSASPCSRGMRARMAPLYSRPAVPEVNHLVNGVMQRQERIDTHLQHPEHCRAGSQQLGAREDPQPGQQGGCFEPKHSESCKADYAHFKCLSHVQSHIVAHRSHP